MFHISKCGVPPFLKQLLESPDLIKVGRAIKGDCTRLLNDFSIKCNQGIVDVGDLAYDVQVAPTRTPSLALLCDKVHTDFKFLRDVQLFFSFLYLFFLVAEL